MAGVKLSIRKSNIAQLPFGGALQGYLHKGLGYWNNSSGLLKGTKETKMEKKW